MRLRHEPLDADVAAAAAPSVAGSTFRPTVTSADAATVEAVEQRTEERRAG